MDKTDIRRPRPLGFLHGLWAGHIRWYFVVIIIINITRSNNNNNNNNGAKNLRWVGATRPLCGRIRTSARMTCVDRIMHCTRVWGCVRTLGCRDGKQEFGIGRVEPNYELFLITLLHNVGRPLQQAVIDYIINACLFSCGGHRPFIFCLPCSSAAGQVDVTREFHHTLTRVINVDPHSLWSSPRYNAWVDPPTIWCLPSVKALCHLRLDTDWWQLYSRLLSSKDNGPKNPL